MAILTSPSERPDTAYQEPEERPARNGRSAVLVPEKTGAGITQGKALPVSGTPQPVPAASGSEGLPTLLGRLLIAFYDWLSGPALTERDRVDAKLAESERIRRAVDSGLFSVM